MHQTYTLESKSDIRRALLGDLFAFTRYMFEKKTGREFMVSQPDGNESHFKTVCRELTNAFLLHDTRLNINLPPGWAKSELCKHFIAWCFAHYPYCKFLYISHSFELATLHTASIRQTMLLPAYRELFQIEIRRDSSAKDFFMTTSGGAVAAFGSQGGITGHDAGLPGIDNFSGAVIIDDIHKPEEIHSDTIRERVKRNYFETIERRVRSPRVPIILIGQRLHEDDLIAHLLQGADGQDWKNVIIKALDDSGNARYPEVNPKSQLLLMKEKQPYVFASQYQQDPMPAGGGLFQSSWFPILDEMPKILTTFVTADTAETDKEYNDATVFSFWGVYRLNYNGSDIPDMYGLHWLDCLETRIEPKDLEETFLDFWTGCMRFKVKPKFAAIEKKSSGVTLISVLKKVQGLRVLDIERSGAKNSKTNRFLEMQPFIASRQVSLPSDGKHTTMCVNHMSKITANNVHRWDDICFVAGTKIATLFGYKNIETVNVHDLIITPFGLRKVLAAGLTKKSEVIFNRGLLGTNNHPVFVVDSFKRLDTVCDADIIDSLSLWGQIRWRYRKLLYLMESNISLQGREGIILAGKKTIRKGSVLRDFMWRSMNFIAERKLKKGGLFIIKTTTILTMSLLIWSVFHVSNIYSFMRKKGKTDQTPKKNYSILYGSEKKLLFGTEVKRVNYGILKMLKVLLISPLNLFVGFVKKNLLRMLSMQKYVVSSVLAENGGQIYESSSLNVSFAQQHLQPKKVYQEAEIEKHVLITVGEEREVYNLTVDKDHVYYANGILVSNCDTVSDAIKIALIDKTMININLPEVDQDRIATSFMNTSRRIDNLRKSAYGK